MQTLTLEKGAIETEREAIAQTATQTALPPAEDARVRHPTLLADVVACHLGLVQPPAGGGLDRRQPAAQTLQRGEGGQVGDSPQPVDTPCALGAAALTGATVPPKENAAKPPQESPARTESNPKPHGYRQHSPPEEIALLNEARAGSNEAFADLYRLHAGRVTRYVAARVRRRSFASGNTGGQPEAIADVVQDAFCEAFAGLGEAHHDVIGWLLTHAAKAYIRYARSTCNQERAVNGTRDKVRREYTYGHTWDERTSVAGDEQTVSTIGRISLVQALARLAPHQRRCIQHRYLEGQTQATTAGLMGKTLSAVKDAERRALGGLRQGLGPTPEAVTASAGL